MNYTFNNSSIVSVDSGTIVLNVSGKTRTFVDAKLVAAVDGAIVLDLPPASLIKGSYVTIHLSFDEVIQRTFISNTNNNSSITYHITQYSGGIKSIGLWQSDGCDCRNATPEEIQELNDQLAAEGKCWNPATMQVEKLRWKPKDRQRYYYVTLGTSSDVDWHAWDNDRIDNDLYQSGNCFKTEEEAKAKLEQIKKLLLEV